MRRPPRAWALLAALVGLTVSLAAQQQVAIDCTTCRVPYPSTPPDPQPVIFRATYTAAAYPNLGWGSSETQMLGVRFDRSFIAGAGPQGQGIVRFAARHCPGCSENGGQYNTGNRRDMASTDPPNGSKRYLRWRMRFAGNHRGLPWGGGSGPSTIQNKIVIVGDGCGANCRFIMTYQTETAGVRNFRLQKDGGAEVVDTGSYPNGQWLDVQVELAPNTNSTGSYAIWVENNTYATPTARKANIAFVSTGHKYVWFGGYMNDGLMADGTHSYDSTDFEYGATFDPNWNR